MRKKIEVTVKKPQFSVTTGGCLVRTYPYGFEDGYYLSGG